MCLPMQDIQEMWIWSQGQEDPLEREMTSHSSILAWKIPCTEEAGGLQSMGSQRIRYDWAHAHTHTHIILITTLWVKWDWYCSIYRWRDQGRGNEGICSRSQWYYRMSNNLENNCTSSAFIPFPNQTCSATIHV